MLLSQPEIMEASRETQEELKNQQLENLENLEDYNAKVDGAIFSLFSSDAPGFKGEIIDV